MRKMLFVLLGLAILLSLCACCINHTWNEATCTDPKTCRKCSATEGSAVGHSWNEATCTLPKTCSKCAMTEGTPIGHMFGIWEDLLLPTCTTKGERKHTCSACAFSEICTQDALGHRWNPWETIEKATTEMAGRKERLCSVCNETETEIIPAIQLSKEEKKELALEVAWEIVDYIGEEGSDLERVAVAAEIVSIFCANCEYTTEGTDYREAYGVFIKGEYSCAGATRALGMVLDCMGIKWKHINENQWTHQWCEVTIDGEIGFADGMVGWAGYGEHPVVQTEDDFIIW